MRIVVVVVNLMVLQTGMKSKFMNTAVVMHIFMREVKQRMRKGGKEFGRKERIVE